MSHQLRDEHFNPALTWFCWLVGLGGGGYIRGLGFQWMQLCSVCVGLLLFLFNLHILCCLVHLLLSSDIFPKFKVTIFCRRFRFSVAVLPCSDSQRGSIRAPSLLPGDTKCQKHQFLYCPLEAGSRNESVPTDLHVKSATLQQNTRLCPIKSYPGVWSLLPLFH